MKQMLLLIFGFLMGVFSLLAKAEDDYLAMAIEAQRLAPSQETSFSQDVSIARQHEKAVTAPFMTDAIQLKTQKPIMRSSNNTSIAKRIKNTESGLFIFVSFSMPRQSLVSYLSTAKKIHAHVVMRGLVDNSFKTTFKEISGLVEEAHGGGIQLDPVLFKTFHITEVPAVVILSDNQNVTVNQPDSAGQFDVITGDIPLAFALKEIRDRGSVAQRSAAEMLSLMREPTHA